MVENLRKKYGNAFEYVVHFRQLEQEKLKLTRELHDTALQEQIIALRELDLLLTEPELQDRLDLKKRLFRVREQQASSIYTLRDFCQSHFVPRLADGELNNQIQLLLDRLQLRTNIEVIYHNRWQKRGLEGERALHVYRILQELIHNTEKHAHATRVELYMEQERDCFLIQYRDDGIGMDSIEQASTAKLGLKGIYSRVECLNGQISFTTAKHAGVQCMLRIPQVASAVK